MAELLLIDSGDTAERQAVDELAQGIHAWLATQAAEALAKRLPAWQLALHGAPARLGVQQAQVTGELAQLRVLLRVGGGEWDAGLQLHREEASWRLYDAEYAGLGALALLKALWADVRWRHESPVAAARALSEQAAERRSRW